MSKKSVKEFGSFGDLLSWSRHYLPKGTTPAGADLQATARQPGPKQPVLTPHEHRAKSGRRR